jgi:hypothetical protein
VSGRVTSAGAYICVGEELGERRQAGRPQRGKERTFVRAARARGSAGMDDKALRTASTLALLLGGCNTTTDGVGAVEESRSGRALGSAVEGRCIEVEDEGMGKRVHADGVHKRKRMQKSLYSA